MGSVLIQKEHGSERAPAFTPVQMWKESAETLARSVQGYDLPVLGKAEEHQLL